MIVVGGLTRLTKSGLSMTDWKLTGSLPPLSREDWLKEFERYKTFPEWSQRKSMTLEEFKVLSLLCLKWSFYCDDRVFFGGNMDIEC